MKYDKILKMASNFLSLADARDIKDRLNSIHQDLSVLNLSDEGALKLIQAGAQGDFKNKSNLILALEQSLRHFPTDNAHEAQKYNLEAAIAQLKGLPVPQEETTLYIPNIKYKDQEDTAPPTPEKKEPSKQRLIPAETQRKLNRILIAKSRIGDNLSYKPIKEDGILGAETMGAINTFAKYYKTNLNNLNELIKDIDKQYMFLQTSNPELFD